MSIAGSLRENASISRENAKRNKTRNQGRVRARRTNPKSHPLNVASRTQTKYITTEVKGKPAKLPKDPKLFDFINAEPYKPPQTVLCDDTRFHRVHVSLFGFVCALGLC